VGLGAAVPVSVGSFVAAGVVVGLGLPGVVLPSHAPRTAARLNITAKPKIFVFITPLSPIVAINNFVPVE
jgi:hypothetical protein